VILMASYITQDEVERLVDQLSQRDQSILLDLARVRVLTGNQLTRLHFWDLSPETRDRTRRRVLGRLVEHQLAATLARTVGGARAGSAGLTYALGIAGQRALPLLAIASGMAIAEPTRARTPWTPSSLFLGHSLGVASLYVELRETEREPSTDCMLANFITEPASWQPNGAGGFVKPDAYAVLRRSGIEDCWWIEVDRATESIPTLKRKLLAYIDFVRSGQLGPDEITPRVLLTVPHDHRLSAVRKIIEGLPAPGEQLILPTLHDQAAQVMIDILRS
jgi:Replication-relaxation